MLVTSFDLSYQKVDDRVVKDSIKQAADSTNFPPWTLHILPNQRDEHGDLKQQVRYIQEGLVSSTQCQIFSSAAVNVVLTPQ
jgi:hypothetical protein